METRSTGRKVFLVHGHDIETKETVARFLESLELNVIILHEQPNSGKTIIEKFEQYADVEFAVVLLTADDVGGPRQSSGDLNARARQNVIFELGYFFGRLGRGRVCALYKSKVELPSDVLGVMYVPLEGDGWKLAIAQELSSSGIPVDLNVLLRT